MASELISASFQTEVDSLVESIVYLPEGTHEIAATVNGKAAKRKVTVDDRILASFATDLQSRQSRNVRPFAGFDHKAGPASFIPKEFRYESGVGLMLDVEWTQAGKSAVEGKDYSYFSPAFLLRNGVPAGLPTHGEIGSLVNEPAFEAMEKIAASHNNNTMDNIQPLIDLGLVPADTAPEAAMELAQAALAELRTQAAENVQAAANHTAEIESITAARDTLANEVETLKASLAKIDDEAADNAVSEAVSAGRIAPQDDKAKAFWKAQIKADKANVEILNSIPAKPVNGETVLAGKTEGEAKETELTGIAKVEAAFKAQKESH
jgi:phage I-like protein